ncbi:MAG: hypothetical protein GC159_10900 [Phycisphaera sp.]|nr:hypothetical protein [Phycisphaera sp.]
MKMKPFDEMIAYVLEGHSSQIVTDIAAACARAGDDRPRFFTIQLLNWLRNTINRDIRHPLVPKVELWRGPLEEIVRSVPDLSDCLVVEDGSVRFRAEIDDGEIQAIRAFVAETYKPQLFRH